MAGVKALRRIQIGEEWVAGSAVGASLIWRGEGVAQDLRTIEFVKEDIGFYEDLGRSYVPQLDASVEIAETPGTFEQLPIPLSAAIENTVVGVADGAGSGYIYQYDLVTTAANPLQTYTLKVGDDQRVDEVEFGYVTHWTLSGSPNEAVRLAASWQGRQATDAEFTASLSLVTVEEILFNKGKLYIDATGGVVGATQKTATWLGFSLDWPSGWKAVFTGDGALYFSKLEYIGHWAAPITGDLILEHDATAEAEIGFARSETVRLVRLEFQGSALTTAGAYTYKTLRADLAVQYTAVPELGDADGDDIVTLPFRVLWSAADSLAAQVIVVNELPSVAVLEIYTSASEALASSATDVVIARA